MGAKTLPENDGQQLNKDDQKNEHDNEQKPTQKGPKRKERIRMFPIWLRIIVVLVLAVVALMTGLMFGYSVMGDGNATDVFNSDTWRHIVDIVSKE